LKPLSRPATFAAGIVGFTFADIVWAPRIGLGSNVVSGDNAHSSTIGTFNAMFPRLPYFAETSLLVPANVIDVRPVLSVRPVEDITVTVGWDTLWRASTTDGLYGSGMAQYAGTAKPGGARVARNCPLTCAGASINTCLLAPYGPSRTLTERERCYAAGAGSA
jgi:hypothetical protein